MIINKIISGGKALDKTVTFISGDDKYAIQSVKSGYEIVAPDSPTQTGYTFLGWGTSASASTYRIFPYVPTLDEESLYANWSANP